MGMKKSDWTTLRGSSTDVSSADTTISYDKCMDQVYTAISDAQVKNASLIDEMSATQLYEYTRNLIQQIVAEKRFKVTGFVKDGKAELNRLIATLQADITDYGPITDAMRDESITELQINDYKTIYAEQHGETKLLVDSLTNEPVVFKDRDELLKIANKLLRLQNVTLSVTGAIQGAMTIEGYRVAAVHYSAASPDKGAFAHAKRSPAIVIRKFSKNKLNLNDLIKFGSMTTEIAEFVRRIPQASLTTVVAGATGSGKTVLLQAFSDERPKEKRTFIVEDQSELNARMRDANGIDQSNTVQFEARPAPAGAKVDLSFPTFENLIIQALRMSPRLFILGEIRTNSVINQAVTAANTGHPFYTTIHAEDVPDTVTRIAMAVAAETPSIPYNVILDIVCKNITFIISQQKLDDGSRKCLQFAEILGTEMVDGQMKPKVNMLFEFQGDGQGIHADGKIHGKYMQVGRISDQLKKKLFLKKLTSEDLRILTSGPAPGEPPIEGHFDPIKL